MINKICVFTSTRADFGMLTPLLREIDQCQGMQLKLLVSGSHLSESHGNTLDEIVAEGIGDYTEVDIGLDDYNSNNLAKVYATGIERYAEYFANSSPHLCIVLGDRYETLAAATAAYFAGIPIAHIAGGETTIGAMDEAFRHSITKMAALHFTTTEDYRRRVIQLGESPDMVFNVGGLFVDNALNLALMNRNELFSDIGIPSSAKCVAAVTLHPETLSGRSPRSDALELLNALREHPDVYCFFSYANADDLGFEINNCVNEFVASYPNRAMVKPSLGRLRYLSLLKNADMIIGNSSSGIVEAPTFSIPSVNVGRRQAGRIMAESIISCECKTSEIVQAISRAKSPAFRAQCQGLSNPHGDGMAAQRMVAIMREKLAAGISIGKTFFDQKC